jgi:ABC-2 type transport system ATP-binding protein
LGLLQSDNLRYTARLNGFTPTEREDRIKSSLAHAGLADAQIALLDEPTAGLDPQATLELLEIIRNLKQRNVSVLLSSHMLERVQSVCDRVALFNKGSIVLIGTVPELGRRVLGGGFHVEVEAEGRGLAERLATVPGVTTVEATGTNRMRLLAERDVRPDAAAAVVAAGGRLLSLSIEEPSLEAIYTRYFENAASKE